MKKLNKILISLAMVLMFALPLLLTGCAVSSEEIGKITIAARENYLEKHEDYENFANTTYKVNFTGEYKEKYPLSYKAKATDTEYKEGIFTSENKYSTEMTVSFKNMDKEDLALYIKTKDFQSYKGTGLDENDCLTKEKSSYSTTEEYIVSFIKDEEGNKTYYVVSTYQSVEDGQKSEKEIYYKEYVQADYIAFISNILTRSSKFAVNSVFFTSSMGGMEMSELIAMMMNYSENNGVITASMKASNPMITTGDASFASYSISGSYSKSGLKSAKAESIYIYSNYEYKNSCNLSISSSANGTFKIPSLENAEEITGSYDPSEIVYIPSSIMEIMMD